MVATIGYRLRPFETAESGAKIAKGSSMDGKVWTTGGLVLGVRMSIPADAGLGTGGTRVARQSYAACKARGLCGTRRVIRAAQ